MYKNKILSILLLNLTLLSGCSVMNSDYDCPLEDTASCMSLSQMDNNITYGRYSDYYKRAESADDKKFYVTHRGLMPKAHPKRVPELTSRIWFAPYEDNSGNFHDASFVYIVTQDSAWVGKPIKPMS